MQCTWLLRCITSCSLSNHSHRVSQVRTGLDGLNLGTVLGVRDLILRSLSAGRVVITAPAESLPELAHVLAVLMDRELRSKRVPCVLTCSPGAVPEGGCAPANIQTAIEASPRNAVRCLPVTSPICALEFGRQ